MSLGRWLLFVAVCAVGSCGDDDGVRIHTGVTTGVAASGVGLGLDDGDGESEGFVVGNGVEWTGIDGHRHESGQPECLPPMSAGAEVALHIVQYEGRARMVLVECRSLPTELDWAGELGPEPFDTYCAAQARSGQLPARMIDDPCADG